MKFVYLLILSSLFYACANPIKYVGQKLPPTQSVDVYVTQASIRRPFETIGMGFNTPKFGNLSPEKMQRNAEKKAREIGADALLIEYYSVVDERTVVSRTEIRIDTIGRYPQPTITAQQGPLTQSGFRITFLKYTVPQ